MTNRELLERIVGDLNELIDKRGNTMLIPALVEIKALHDEVCDMERLLAAMGADEPYDDDPLDWRD